MRPARAVPSAELLKISIRDFQGGFHVCTDRGREAETFPVSLFCKIPEAGKFEFLDSGWMDEVTKGRLRGELSDKQYAERIESIKRFERQLTDNGYLVLKLFFQIGKEDRRSGWKNWKATRTLHGVWARTTGGRTSIMTNVRKSSTNISQILTLP